MAKETLKIMRCEHKCVWPFFNIMNERVNNPFRVNDLVLFIALLYSAVITAGYCKVLQLIGYQLNQFQPSFAFHIETSHLFCSAKQLTGFYMKRNTELEWIKMG